MTIPRGLRRVLELMFVGKTDDEIADIIGASESMVRSMVEEIVKALDADNRFNAIYNAFVEGLLTPPEPRHLHIHGLELDVGMHEVRSNGRLVHLSVAEFKLLRMFMAHPGRVFSRDQIIDCINGAACAIQPRSVDVHIHRLREALGDSACLIESERAIGYRFRALERVAA